MFECLAASALYGCDAKGPHVRRGLRPLAVKSGQIVFDDKKQLLWLRLHLLHLETSRGGPRLPLLRSCSCYFTHFIFSVDYDVQKKQKRSFTVERTKCLTEGPKRRLDLSFVITERVCV